jgi:putative transposase
MSKPAHVIGPAVGIDLGLNCFAVTSENERIEAPKPLLHAQALLAKRQRMHSKKQKGSNNCYKSAMGLARLHRRVRNVRNDFLHKLTTNLAKTKSVLVVEDLGVGTMLRNHSLAKHIADAGWAEFRRQLVYKTQWYGSELVVAPKFYPSSKTCSRCGHVKATLSLAERTYICSECDFEIDRDLNAAQNLEQLATRSSRGSNACGDCVRPRPAHRLRRRSLKQELALSEMTVV